MIDLLLLPHAADGTAKSDAYVQGHSPPSWNRAADPYTAYKSHVTYNTFVREYYRFLMLLAEERTYTAKLSNWTDTRRRRLPHLAHRIKRDRGAVGLVGRVLRAKIVRC